MEIDVTIHCTAGDCRGNSVWTLLLPYIEQGNTFSAYDPKLGWNTSYHVNTLGNQVMPMYVCPSDGKWTLYPTAGTTSHRRRPGSPQSRLARRVYQDGVFQNAVFARLAEVTDGTRTRWR